MEVSYLLPLLLYFNLANSSYAFSVYVFYYFSYSYKASIYLYSSSELVDFNC